MEKKSTDLQHVVFETEEAGVMMSAVWFTHTNGSMLHGSHPSSPPLTA